MTDFVLDDDAIRTAAAAVATRLDPTIRLFADRFYEGVMTSVQDYLADNVAFNIRAWVDSANRESVRLRGEIETLDYPSPATTAIPPRPLP